jgi:hypothetical protein
MSAYKLPTDGLPLVEESTRGNSPLEIQPIVKDLSKYSIRKLSRVIKEPNLKSMGV